MITTGGRGMIIDSTYLSLCAYKWLTYKKQLNLISFERPIGWGVAEGIPDILAVNYERFLIEIEIKVSVNDFKNDQNKRKWYFQGRINNFDHRAYFYYLVTPEISDKCKELLPPGKGFGLLTLGNCLMYGVNEIKSLVKVTRNSQAKRLSIKQCIRMVRNQTRSLGSVMEALNNYRNLYRENK